MPDLCKKKDYLHFTSQPLCGSSFRNWFKILRENNFDIYCGFIIKAIFVTVAIITLTPLRILEKTKHSKNIEKMKKSSPIFIIGHWRGGTTFLHNILSKDKNFAYVSMFDSVYPWICLHKNQFLKNLVSNALPNNRLSDDVELNANVAYEEEDAISNLCSHSYRHGWAFPKNIEKYFDKYVLFEGISKKELKEWKKTYKFYVKKNSYKHNGKKLILKSLINTGRIKHILDIFPDAKFIYLYRNPYEVYPSTLNFYKKSIPIFSFQQIDEKEVEKITYEFYKKLLKSYEGGREFIPTKNLIEISYDELVKNPLETLEKIYKNLGIKEYEKSEKDFKKYLGKIKNYETNKYDLSDVDKNKIKKELVPIFEKVHNVKIK